MRQYFSSTYQEARDKFLKAANNCDAVIHSEKITTDLNNKPLYIDIAHLGDKSARQMIIISCGIHGIEGYTGSALMHAYMQTLSDMANTNNVHVVLIHPINPVGMAYHQRFNDDNIDLNRNGDQPAESSILIKSACDTYNNLNPIINPKAPYQSYKQFKQQLDDFSEKHKLDRKKLANIIIGGQQQYPDGIFYKGKELSAELSFLFDYLSNLNHSNLEHVTALDIHTGIGKKNTSTLGFLFSMVSENKKQTEDLNAQAKLIFTHPDEKTHHAGDMPTIMGTTAEAVKAGGNFSGNLAAEINNCFPNTKVNPFVVEFGTHDDLEYIIYTLVQGNALRSQTNNFKDLASIEAIHNHPLVEDLSAAFYPQDDAYADMVINRGREIFKGLFEFSQLQRKQVMTPLRAMGITASLANQSNVEDKPHPSP